MGGDDARAAGANGGGRGLCGSLKWLCRVGLAGKTVREVVAEGDAFFDARRFALAEERYLKAIERSPDGVYCSLLFHRMAWGHLLSGEEDKAMGRFEQAVRSTVDTAAEKSWAGRAQRSKLRWAEDACAVVGACRCATTPAAWRRATTSRRCCTTRGSPWPRRTTSASP